jgi:hypothetical protein
LRAAAGNELPEGFHAPSGNAQVLGKLRDDLLFDKDQSLLVCTKFLEVEVFFLDPVFVQEARIYPFLLATSAAVNVLVDDDDRILEFLIFFNEILCPVV